MSEPKEKVIAKYRTAFAVYEDEEAGKISTADLGNVMRAVGQYITEEEMQKIVKEFGDEKKSFLNFSDFLNIIEGRNEYIDNEDEVLAAFKVFDVDDTGFVSAAELKDALTSLGEKLTIEEVEELFSEGEIDDNGCINYYELCKAVMQYA